MARQHVFPLCRPSFNKIDFESIDESKSLDLSATREQYKVVSSTGVLGTVAVQKSDNRLNYSDFYAPHGGEYLVSDDISAPSETTLDWSGDINDTQVNLRFVESRKNSNSILDVNAFILTDALYYNDLKIGDIVCVGSKDLSGTTFSRNNLPSLTHYKGEEYADLPGYNIEEFPFTENGLGEFGFRIGGSIFDKIPAKPVWTTVMFVGTRWVILGSNNWY